jgi:hypothetical protein
MTARYADIWEEEGAVEVRDFAIRSTPIHTPSPPPTHPPTLPAHHLLTHQSNRPITHYPPPFCSCKLPTFKTNVYDRLHANDRHMLLLLAHHVPLSQLQLKSSYSESPTFHWLVLHALVQLCTGLFSTHVCNFSPIRSSRANVPAPLILSTRAPFVLVCTGGGWRTKGAARGFAHLS